MSRRPRRSDHYTRRAKQQSYPARSVFKLEEIDRKHRIFKPSQAVLDLGCAPGSWLLYAAKQIGTRGIAIGIDLHGVDAKLPQQAIYRRGDIYEISKDELLEASGRPYDVVLSDMAPHTSGQRFVDQQRSLRLLERALEIALEISRPGASFVGKVFHSEDVDTVRNDARNWYSKVSFVRPKATRKGSYEVYLVCLQRKSTTP